MKTLIAALALAAALVAFFSNRKPPTVEPQGSGRLGGTAIQR